MLIQIEIAGPPNGLKGMQYTKDDSQQRKGSAKAFLFLYFLEECLLH